MDTSLLLLIALAALAGGAALRWRRLQTRKLQADIAALRERLETLSDSNFELHDTADRLRSLLQAQDDLIVRRRQDGVHHLRECGLLRAHRPPRRRADRHRGERNPAGGARRQHAAGRHPPAGPEGGKCRRPTLDFLARGHRARRP